MDRLMVGNAIQIGSYCFIIAAIEDTRVGLELTFENEYRITWVDKNKLLAILANAA